MVADIFKPEQQISTRTSAREILKSLDNQGKDTGMLASVTVL